MAMASASVQEDCNMDIHVVVALTGEKLKYTLSRTSSVAELKDCVYSDKKIEVSKQILLFGDQRLNDFEILLSYGIKHQSTVCMVLKWDQQSCVHSKPEDYVLNIMKCQEEYNKASELLAAIREELEEQIATAIPDPVVQYPAKDRVKSHYVEQILKALYNKNVIMV